MGGDINVYATDDGVNAANANASQSEIFFKMTGGTLNVEVGQGDTDPIDSNGDIIVSGGTINLTGQSGFDFDGSATYTGGGVTLLSMVKNKQRLKTQCLAAVVPKVVGNQVALEEVTKES